MTPRARLARALGVCALLAWPWPVPAQESAPQSDPESASSRYDQASLLQAHVRCAVFERQSELTRRWSEADADARAAALAALQAARPPGAGRMTAPTLEAMSRALLALEIAKSPRSAEGQALETLRALERQARGVDLRVAPAFFLPHDPSASAAGAGQAARIQPMTVRLASIASSDPPRSVQAHLFWISPTGERTRARSEAAPAELFTPEGFDMYVHAPASAPGRWQLVLELEKAGQVASGWRVEVECIAAQPALLESEDPARAYLLRCLEARRTLGLRQPIGMSTSELLAALEPQDPAKPCWRPLFPSASHVHPAPRVGLGIPGLEAWVWGWIHGQQHECLVASFSGPSDPTETLLLGSAGFAFANAQHGNGIALAAIPIGPESTAENLEHDFARALELLAPGARAGASANPDGKPRRVAMARGGAVGWLASAFYGHTTLPFDAGAFAMEWDKPTRPNLFAGLERLVLARGGLASETALASLPLPECTWIDLAEPAFLEDRHLPELLARWIRLPRAPRRQ